MTNVREDLLLRSAVADLKKAIPDWKEIASSDAYFEDVKRKFVELIRSGDTDLPPEDLCVLALVLVVKDREPSEPQTAALRVYRAPDEESWES